MARSRNERRKWAQGKVATRQRKALELEIASDAHFVEHMTKHGTMHVPSRHKAKEMRKASHAMDEQARFQSGFKGVVPAVGPEMRSYIPTLRVKDGSRFIQAKCWMRKQH